MKTKPVVLVLVIVATLLQVATCLAQTTKTNGAPFALMWSAIASQALNPPHLSEMPTADRVKAEIKGADSIDTAARQAGAFWQLRKVIYDIALSQRRNDRQVTPDEKRLADAYHAAWYNVWQPVQKALSEDRPRLFKLEGYTVNRDLLNEVLDRLCSLTFRAEYYKAVGQVDARIQARKEADKREQERVKAEIEQYRAQQEPKPWQRELARCIASGRSETQCFTESLGKGATELFPILSKTPAPSGLSLTGAYSAGGFSIWFYPDNAIVACNQVNAEASYALEMKNNQVRLKLLPSQRLGGLKVNEDLMKLLPQSSNPDEWQGQRIAFSLRPDGKISGSGPIKVTGPVAVGETTQQTTEQKRIQPHEAAGYNRLDVHRDGLGLYVEERVTKNVPVYESRTAGCTLGILSPTGPSPVAGSISTLTSSALNLAFSGEDKAAGKMPPPGLRMNGRYADQNGFDIEFHPESAVVACRQAVVARDYSVSIKGNRVLVNIQNSANPIELELRPDGTLAGGGQVQVNGRVFVGKDAKGELVFQPTTDACNLGVLTPTQMGSGSTAGSMETSGAPAPTKPANSTAPARPSNASGSTNPTASGASAILSIVSGFAIQPGGASPLTGKTLGLLKDSFENVLTKAGFPPAVGMSAIQSWVVACSQGQPACKQGAAAVAPYGAAFVKVDSTGKAQFPPLPAGTYYLFGSIVQNNRPIIWDLRIDLKPGANSVTLDQRNSTPIN